LTRWLLQLEAFNFTVSYKEGKQNANADVMSRLPELGTADDAQETNALELVELKMGISLDEIRQAQAEHPTVVTVMTLVDNQEAEWPINAKMRPFYDKREELFIQDDILCRQVNDELIQIILPPSLHDKALQFYHDEAAAGHAGIDRTEGRWSQDYYWPNARKIIATYIRACEVCQKFKPSKENTKAELQPIVSRYPMDIIEIDFVGPLPTSGRQNRFILSIIDHFSKFAVAMPTQRQDTATVIDCMTKFCSQFGIPTRILSDQGRSLISHDFLEWCKAWGIRKATSTSYHPQTQGLCERYNQTIIGILKKYVYECPTTWCERLPMAVYAYNSAVQETIGVTPFEVMTGRKPVSFAETFKSGTEEPGISAYVASLRKTMRKIQDIIVPRQQQAREEMADRYNNNAAGDCFEIGDQVLLYNPAVKLGDSKKFHPYYHGPFQITEKEGVNCRITPLAEGKLKEQWVHQNRLKRSYFKIKPLTDVTVDHNEAARSSEEETDSDSSEDDLWVEPAIRQRALTAVDTATRKAGQPVAQAPILPSTPEGTSTAGQAAKSQLSPGPLTVRLDDQARALSPVHMDAVRAPSPVPAAVVANRAERMRD
jgi:transposase InsO family protein